jgi:hypothetical protein
MERKWNAKEMLPSQSKVCENTFQALKFSTPSSAKHNEMAVVLC